MFTVGAFARISGVSAKALRAYDAMGLFRPVRVDRLTGYRYYSAAQLPQIRRIVALRNVGMGLDAIQRSIAGLADLATVLAERRAELEREQREVERRLAALEIRVASGVDSGGGPDVVIRPVAEEPVATLSLDALRDMDVGAAFHELEARVRDAGLRANRPPGLIVGDEGVIVFVPVTRPRQSMPGMGYRLLPARRMATILQPGGYAALPVARRSLERWAHSAGYTVDGPLRIVYLQFDAERELRLPPGYLVERAADFLTELQLPVR
jgi:DNA-binding transcriptional MerR regulator